MPADRSAARSAGAAPPPEAHAFDAAVPFGGARGPVAPAAVSEAGPEPERAVDATAVPYVAPPLFSRATWGHPAFREGMRDMGPITVGIGAWALVTGVALIHSGMPAWAAVLMSLTVFAGTAQLATAPLLAVGAPLPVVWFTALALNLRFVIYGLQWRPYFKHLTKRERLLISYVAADLNFVVFMKRFPEPRPQPEQWPYFWGTLAVNFVTWHVLSLVGMAAAHRISPAWGLGFAGTVAMFGMLLSLLHDRATWLPAALAGLAALLAFAWPLKANVLVAIGAAVLAGRLVDAWAARRAPSAAPRPVGRDG